MKITGVGGDIGKEEDVQILSFTGRRLREDYDEDELSDGFDADGVPRRLASGAGQINLVAPLVNSYTDATGATVQVTSVTVVVGADPITRYGDKSVKFWLTNYELTPLLLTNHINLYGSTFPGPTNDLQWFERFVITSSNDAPIVQVSIKKDIKHNRTAPPRVLSQLDVTIKDAAYPMKAVNPIYVGEGGHEMYQDFAITNGQVQFRVGRELRSPPRLNSKSNEYVYITTPDLVFGIAPAHAAVEFRSKWHLNDRDSAYKYTHLDLFIIEQFGENKFGGILPELWGVRPMSDKVRAMLDAPAEENKSIEGVSVCEGQCLNV